VRVGQVQQKASTVRL